MKPRTKFEQAVIAQSGHLRPLATAPRRWAFRNTINHYAFRLSKGRTTCMDCGHSWVMSEASGNCTCPNCKAKLEVKETYVRKCQQKSYLNVIDTCGVEKARVFDPLGHAGFDPSGKIRLPP